MKKKKKYIAVFMLKEQESYTILKKKKLNPLKNIVSFKGKSFVFKTNIATFSKGLKQFFLFDVNITSGHLLFIKNKKSLITPNDIDDICVKKVVSQLTVDLTNTAFKVNIMMIIIGLALGGLIGWIAGGYA